MLLTCGITVILLSLYWLYGREAWMIRKARTIANLEEIEAFSDKYDCLGRYDRSRAPDVLILIKTTQIPPVYLRSVTFHFTMEGQQVAKCDIGSHLENYVRESIRAYLGL